MKECTRTAFNRLARITGPKCATCPTSNPHRCCDVFFCDATEQMMVERGEPVPRKPGIGGIPFMGPRGCILAPEQRPLCTAYVCSHHVQEDRAFRREYDRLIQKLNRDPNVGPIAGVRR